MWPPVTKASMIEVNIEATYSFCICPNFTSVWEPWLNLNESRKFVIFKNFNQLFYILFYGNKEEMYFELYCMTG